MPQTPVSTDLTASSVNAVAPVLNTLRGGGLDSRPTARTACPPRLRRVVAFTSASQISARVVEDAPTAQEARPEATDA